MTFKVLRRWFAAVCLSLCLAVIPGTGRVAPEGPTEPPLVVNGDVTLQSLSQFGGSVNALAMPGNRASYADATSPLTLAGQLGGTIDALEFKNNRLYAGVGARLVIFNVVNPIHPSLIGQSEPGRNLIRGIALIGHYAYVADGGEYDSVSPTGRGGLRIIDVANPAQPQQVKVVTIPYYPTFIAIVGSYAYITDNRGFTIWNVADPLNPVQVGEYIISDTQTYPIYPIGNLVVVGEKVYLAAGQYGLHIVNIANPTAPQKLGSLLPSDASGISIVAIQGDYAYLAGSGNSDVYIANVSNAATPSLIYKHYQYWVSDLAVAGNFLYIVSGGFSDPNLTVLNIENPSRPAPAGTLVLSLGSRVVRLAGSFAYLAGEEDNLSSINISDPYHLTLAGVYTHLGSAGSLTVADSHVYVQAEGLHIVDTADPTNLHHLGYYDQAGGYVAVVGHYAYQTFSVSSGGTMKGGIRAIDVTDPSAPQAVGILTLDIRPRALVAAGNFLYVGHEQGVRVVDISDPLHLSARGAYTTTPGAWSYDSLVVVGNRLYVGDPGFYILDVSDPDWPVKLGEYTAETFQPRSVTVVGNYAYVALGSNWLSTDAGLWIFDVSDSSNPVKVGACQGTWGAAYSIAVQGRYAYIGAHGAGSQSLTGTKQGGIWVVDVADVAHPAAIGSYENSGIAYDLAVAGDKLYVADGNNGLLVFHLPVSTISGRVVDSAGQPLAGVTVWAGRAHSATTTLSGTYVLTNVFANVYHVTPELPGYLFDPPTRDVWVPPAATGQDFVARHIVKAVTPAGLQRIAYGDWLTYTLQLAFTNDLTTAVYDPIPTATIYVSDSLVAPAGVVYDLELNAITGTVTAAAYTPLSITFAVQAVITGTAESAPRLTNQACLTGPLTECSNVVTNYTYVWATYLPLVMRQY